MRKSIAFVLFILSHCISYAQSDTIQSRIILIGDAGELNYGREPVIDAARKLIPFDKKTTVIFLGDNIYNSGLPADFMPGYDSAKAVLDSQINIARGTQATVYFIPGNHDWNNEDPDGPAIVNRQQAYINNLGNKKIIFTPSDGCPGPEAFEINKDIELIVFDSQWFIRPDNERPGIESDCEFKTPDQFYNELQDMITRYSNKLIILACHHTLKSYGVHGGYFTWKQIFFPFTDISSKLYIPIPFGFIYPIVRGVFGVPEDLNYPAYRNMINDVETYTKGHKNIIFVAGHEHTLQLIKDSTNFYIVSGAGSKHTRVSKSKKTDYVKSALGFACLEISKNKNVNIKYYIVNQDSVHMDHSQHLLNFSTLVGATSDSPKIAQTQPIFATKDSVTVPVNANYQKVSSLHKFFTGQNYRKEWATPVQFKVFNFKKENGGDSVESLGGGRETVTLKLVDSNNHRWVLRTVDKGPSGTVPEVLKPYIPGKVMKDLVSAEHPYGALIVPKLADAARVIHAEPKYYFVPDDPAFGIYQKLMANKVCLLEMRDPIPDETDSKSSSKVIDQITKDSKNHVDQPAVLRARLLDMFIGDWDRHFDQWRFGTTDTGVGKLYYPIPRDRDQAFFYSNGLLVKGLTVATMPYLQGFRKRFKNIKWFNWEERNFDRLFMNSLDEKTWRETITEFQRNESDTVINEALMDLPAAIYQQDAKQIAAKLRSRRDLLLKSGLQYYRFLSKEVNVVGSNKNEYFKVFGSGDSLEVKVFKRKHDTDSSSVMFDRVFSPNTTKYINLYGLNGDDIFEVDSTAKSKIRLRIVGGKGKDTFNIHGNIPNLIYDLKKDSNFIVHRNSKTKDKISSDPNANFYDINGYNYNTYRLPLLSIGYNEEDKLIAGGGYSLTTYGFRKDPYSTFQALTALYSFSTGKFQVNYNGEFNQLIQRKYDIVARGSLFNSVLNNFFGFGNSTSIDKSKNINFYKVRYNYVTSDLALRKRFHHLAELIVGASYYHYWNHYYDNKGKILGQPAITGLDSAGVYSIKNYLGPKISILIHNLNNDFMPTRGVYWDTELSSLFGMNDKSGQISTLKTDMTVYASFKDPTRLVTVLRFGWGHIFNKDYEYFQAMNLGENNYLRGFRKNRFSGRSSLYQSIEFRYKLFESSSYILPGTFGLIAFNDIGRVFDPKETSHKWHDDYGGGIYYTPFNFFAISGTIAFSGETNLLNFSIGTKFNITY